MKTVTELKAWLNTANHIKCTLVEITEVGNAPASNFYFSSVAYNSSNINYLPIVNGGLNFSESLSTEGAVSSSFGSLELINTDGIYDSYLNYVWKRRPIQIYLGDPSWPRTDFVLIFDGLIEDLTSTDEKSLVISIFDKLQKLNDNVIVTETTELPVGYSQNLATTENKILPLLFGECFNVQPLFVHNGSAIPPSTVSTGKVYMYHNGPSNGLIEVRDNGAPIDVLEDRAKGTFSLVSEGNLGTITCSAQGNASNYTAEGESNNTIPELIKTIVTTYATPNTRFGLSDIDFTDFDNTSKVGVFLKDRANILQVCSELAQSVNAGLVCPSISIDVSGNVSASKLKLVELKIPAGTPKHKFTDADMVQGSLVISQTFPVRTSIKLSYCKNYTVQTTVASNLNPAVGFLEEYSYVEKKAETSIQTLYKDTGTAIEEPTLLLEEAAAELEAEKRLLLWSVQRFLVTAKYFPEHIFVQLGEIVTIKSSRFNLSTPKTGIVFSIERDWVSGMVQIGVLI